MHRVRRLIFRYDYSPNFDVLDGMGAVLKIVMNDENFWQQYSLSEVVCSADFEDQSLRRSITVGHETINGVIDFILPIALDSVSDHSSYVGFDKIVKAFLAKFDIQNINRGGLRIVCVNEGSRTKAGEQFRRFFNNDFLKTFEDEVGVINKPSFFFEGVTSEDLGYRVNIAPVSAGEKDAYLNTLQPEQRAAYKEDKTLFIGIDIDLFEHHFNFGTLSLKKWSKDKWPVFESIILNAIKHTKSS
jgi:hypothetical protein